MRDVELDEGDPVGGDVVAQAHVLGVGGERFDVAGGEHDRVPFPRVAVGDGASDVGAGPEDEDGAFGGTHYRSSRSERRERKRRCGS